MYFNNRILNETYSFNYIYLIRWSGVRNRKITVRSCIHSIRTNKYPNISSYYIYVLYGQLNKYTKWIATLPEIFNHHSVVKRSHYCIIYSQHKNVLCTYQIFLTFSLCIIVSWFNFNKKKLTSITWCTW